MRAIATRNLETQCRADPDEHSWPYFDAWEQLLRGPIDTLTRVMTSTDQADRDLRHASPFAGVLAEEERLGVLLRTDGGRVAQAIGVGIEEQDQ